MADQACAFVESPGIVPGVGVATGASEQRGSGAFGHSRASASNRLISRMDSGTRPGSAGGETSGEADGGAWLPGRFFSRGGDGADGEGGHDEHQVATDRGVKPGLALVQAGVVLGELEVSRWAT